MEGIWVVKQTQADEGYNDTPIAYYKTKEEARKACRDYNKEYANILLNAEGEPYDVDIQPFGNGNDYEHYYTYEYCAFDTVNMHELEVGAYGVVDDNNEPLYNDKGLPLAFKTKQLAMNYIRMITKPNCKIIFISENQLNEAEIPVDGFITSLDNLNP